MIIAFFNTIKTWGGGEKWHFEAASHFAQLGYTVYFFGNKESELAAKIALVPKIHFIDFPLTNLSFLNPLTTQKLRKIFYKLQVETLIINHPGDLKVAAKAANYAGVKRVIYRRGSAIPIKDSWLNRRIFSKYVTAILANSQATKDTITAKNKHLFPKDKISVIYNPIAIEEFLSRPTQAVYHAQEGEIVLGNLGRLAPEKNQKFLIDLSAALKAKGIKHRILIGGTGKLLPMLREYAQAKGCQDEVIFLGFIGNVKDLLASIDIFILCSLWEGFGYVLAEASLAKKPVIAFNNSSIPEIVIHEKTGLLIPENNVEDAVEAVEKFRNNPTLAAEYGNNGFTYAQKKFNKTKIYAELTAYLLKA